jgi:hypothetical protein
MFDFSAMESLALCDQCGHGIPHHDGGGCHLRNCRCEATREATIESALQAAREELRAQWDAAMEKWGRA